MLAPLQGRALGIFLRHCPQLQELCLLGDPVLIFVHGLSCSSLVQSRAQLLESLGRCVALLKLHVQPS